MEFRMSVVTIRSKILIFLVYNNYTFIKLIIHYIYIKNKALLFSTGNFIMTNLYDMNFNCRFPTQSIFISFYS